MIVESSDEPRPFQIVLCPDFTRSEWRLPVALPAARLLIGWRVHPPPVDAGVPAPIADILATALCRQATVTFPVELPSTGRHRLLRRSWRLGRDFVWSSSRDPKQVAASIFEGSSFSWPMQGQVVVLSEPGTSPKLDEGQLELASTAERFAKLASIGATGVLLPGVDGDVAGLFAREVTDIDAIAREIWALAREAGGDCASLTEGDFTRSLSSV